MSANLRDALEKRLNKFIPKSDDDFSRKKLIHDYALIFTEEDIMEILNEKKPLYFDWQKSEWIYL